MRAFRTSAREVVDVPLPEVKVLGVDETRRGRTKWSRTPTAAKAPDPGSVAHRVRRRSRPRGLLGQVEGRTGADVLAWLSTTPRTWRKNITHVAIDMAATYRAAIRTGLPDATVVVDHFHVVQLANINAVHGQAPHHRREPRPTRTGQ